MKLSLGPILYYWPRATVETFYQRALETSVDAIYLGESVCAKRRELRTEEWLELARELANSGKEIILSTLALLESRADLSTLKRLCANSPCLIEANDMAAVNLLSEQKLPFVTGHSINIYNAYTLKTLYKRGLKRWVMPLELSAETLRAILADANSMGFADKIETELFVYGKLPLAYSARCFTARAKNLPKDDCQLSCLEYPDGLMMKTQESQELFTLNGIQTQSGATYNLIGECQKIREMGVDMIRISPQIEGTNDLIKRFRKAMEGESPHIPLIPEEHCNGYWYGQPGMVRVRG